MFTLKIIVNVVAQAKITKSSFKPVFKSMHLLELIHTDFCDNKYYLTRGGKCYFVTFIDDFSKYTYVYLLRTKDDTFGKFKIFEEEIENKTGKKIKRIRSDRGGEFLTSEFVSFCEQHGIIREFSAPNSPPQNGVPERKNRTLLEMVSAMLLHSKLPNNLWGEALYMACYINNRILHKGQDKTPYEFLNNRKPNIWLFQSLGLYCLCTRCYTKKT